MPPEHPRKGKKTKDKKKKAKFRAAAQALMNFHEAFSDEFIA